MAVQSPSSPPPSPSSPSLPRGLIKKSALDFVVDELPAYEPTGAGPHLFVHFKKTNLTTDAVVHALSKALNVNRRDVGVAGLKDKVGVTTQWISLPLPVKENDAKSFEDRLTQDVKIDGVEILEYRRHGNKLKTGHLKGNRFTIVVRDVDARELPEINAAFERMSREGVPNAFGAQRFGREGDNAERARAWLTGREPAPRDPRLRRFHFSAFQSALFNAVLDERVKDGSWNKPVLGDLLKKEETGGIFVCTDVQLDRERAAQGELCPTGPIVGDRMRQPEAEAFDLEQRIVAPCIEGIDLHRARSLGEGTRRALRLRVTELSHERLDADDSSLDEVNSSEHLSKVKALCAIEVRFVLPKGAYATTVLSNVFAAVDASASRRDNTDSDNDDTNSSERENESEE